MRKLLALLLSGLFLWTATIAAASPAALPLNPPPATQPADTASGRGNQPPLPPGRALDIRRAQAEEFSDLGMGVIIASWVAATAILFLVVMGDDDDDDESPSGTN